MPRNGSGTSSVVNTFVPFTTADANDVNANFDDIADQLTNSLPRDGQAGMTGQLKADDGTVSLPGITFANDLDTGIRRVGANKLAIVTAGADQMTFDAWGPIGTLLKGMIHGLTLSNNGSDATNDIDIAVGYAASDSATPELMTLGTAITKRLDAGWSVGTNQGGLDTGSIANTTYHVFLIQRSDTGVVDALFSTSATAPTMPANYDRKRRIGSIIRESAAIVSFNQMGDVFRRASVNAISGTTPYTSLLTNMLTPLGIQTQPIFRVNGNTAASGACFVSADSAAVGSATTAVFNAGSGAQMHLYQVIAPIFTTNTSSQIYTAMAGSGTITTFAIVTLGWIDIRGRI